MKIFPAVDATFVSNYTVDELSSQIKEHLTASTSKPSFGLKTNFQGTVREHMFQLTAYPRTPKGINPIAKGLMKVHEGETRITVAFELPDIIKVFFVIWFLGTTVAAVTSTYFIISESRYTDFFLYLPICMVLLGYFFVKIMREMEISKLKQLLSKTFPIQELVTK